jgi:hypothetical protein
MTNASTDKLFRQAAEAEAGEPVSAGGWVAHFRMAWESGRAFYVDLSAVPEEKRPALVAEIKEIVNRAIVQTPAHNPSTIPNASTPSA